MRRSSNSSSPFGLAEDANVPSLDGNPGTEPVADEHMSHSSPAAARLGALHVATAAPTGVQFSLTLSTTLTHIWRQMKFSILSLCCFVLYVALVFASLRYPNPSLEVVVRLACYISIAVATVVAFDRKSTPLFAFAVFALLGGTGIVAVSSNLILSVLEASNTRTGSVEYSALESMLYHHLVMACALVGFVFGCVLTSFNRPGMVGADPADRS